MAKTFQPVILFDVETDADRRAEAMVHSLFADVMSTMETERNAQLDIGLSEIGNDCTRCVVHELSRAPHAPVASTDWKAQIGTFGHAGLEEKFRQKYGHLLESFAPDDAAPLYHPEADLEAFQYKWLTLTGHCDLYVEGATWGVVTDWKFQGEASLKKSGAGHLSGAYRVQMHSYGYCWERLGKPVTHVLLFALPRDDELNAARPILMRYDRQIALAAFARIQAFIDAHEMLEALYPGQGWQKLYDAQPPSTSFCFGCKRRQAHEHGSFVDQIVG